MYDGKMLVVFDYDGTVGLYQHRKRHIEQEPKDYDSFHEAAEYDQPNIPVIEVLKAMSDRGHRVEIWTGREEKHRPAAQRWLVKHLGPYAMSTRLRMRRTGDKRDTNVVKGEWAAEPHNRPDLVFDDRNKTTKYWREQGIPCCQVDENT